MTNQRKHWGIEFIQFIITIVLFLIHYNGLLTIPSLNANPILLLPFLISFCMFSQEITGAVAGLLIGIFMDSMSSSGSFFHTFLFFIIGLTVSLLSHYLLNNNFRSAIMLSILASIVYFLLRWFFFHALVQNNFTYSVDYLNKYALPSIIYTNIFILPIYFLQSYLNRLKTK